MRLLYFHHTLPPDSFAGSEIYQYRLAQAMANRHEVAMVYREANPTLPEYNLRRRDEGGMKIFAVNNTFRDCTSFELTYRNPEIESRVEGLLGELRPEVVHFGHVTCLSTGLPALARRHGASVLMTLHDYWLLCQRGQLVKRDYSLCTGPSPAGCSTCLADQIGLSPRTKRAAQLAGRYFRYESSSMLRRLAQIYSLARLRFSRVGHEAILGRGRQVRELFDSVDLFLSPSRFLRDFFIRSGVPADRILFSRLGMDKGFLASYRRTVSDRLRLAYIGSILPTKGLHVLLDAMDRLRDESVSLSVHGAFSSYHGDATYEPAVRPRLDQPGTHYAGSFDHEDLGRVLSEVDVLVVPSVWYENSPLTIQEAHEAGIPVVASDMGGMRELVEHGRDGLLFRPGSAEDLARQIRTLARDRALVQRLASGAPPQKSMAENAEEMEELYRQVRSHNP